MSKATDVRRGKGFGYLYSLNAELDLICMIRCFECGRENYAPTVATGNCAWCGFNPNRKKQYAEMESRLIIPESAKK